MAKTTTTPKVKAGKTVTAMRFCANPPRTTRVLSKNISDERAKLILTNATKWVNGTTLHYYFFNNKADGEFVTNGDGSREWKTWVGNPGQYAVVRKAFAAWKKLGIGLNFKEVKNREDAQIRIGFMEDDGAWSYVGRDILHQKVNARTMNFGWDIAVSDQHNGIGTAIHEIGHTLGLQHEHQNPFAGIEWNEPAVYAALAAPPNNWDKATTYHNIIKKLDKREVNGSAWDPDSIMHYPFDAGLINKPVKYRSGIYPSGGLSKRDKEYALAFYPTVNAVKDTVVKADESYDIVVKNSEQQNFVFKPTLTKYYTLQTSGELDTVMVLSEQLPGKKLLYLSGDDNSGTGDNALIKIKLFRSKTYLINLKVYFKTARSKAAFMIS